MPSSSMVSMSSRRFFQRFQLVAEFFFHRFDALARRAIVFVGVQHGGFVEVELLLDHPALEVGWNGDAFECAVAHDDRIPGVDRGTGQEASALVGGEVRLIGDQDAGGGVELQEFA